MGNLLHHCVKVRRAIELSCGVVSGVGPDIHVLDGSPRASRGRGCFWHGFRHFANYFVQHLTIATYGYILVCKNRQYFLTHGIPSNSASNSLSCDIVRFKIKVGFDAKFTCKRIKTNATRPLCSMFYVANSNDAISCC